MTHGLQKKSSRAQPLFLMIRLTLDHLYGIVY